MSTPTLTLISVPAAAAAHAARLSLNTLRYASSARLPMLAPTYRRPGEWRAYAAVEVVRFAILGRLMERGFTVSESAAVIQEAVDPLLGGVIGCGLPLSPAHLLRSTLVGRLLRVSRTSLGVYPSLHCVSDTIRPGGVILDLYDIAADAIGRLPVRAGGSAAAGEIAPRAAAGLTACDSDRRQEGTAGLHACDCNLIKGLPYQ